LKPHVFHPSHFTANNLKPGNGWDEVAKREGRLTCRICGASKHSPIHFMPRSRNPFPLFAGTPFSRPD
jgi:hypothetical protein